MTDLMKPRHPGGRPPIYNSVEDMERDINAFFDQCDAKELPYTITGLALAIGMDRRSLINYENKDGFFPAIKRARRRVEQYAEQQLFIGKNQTGTIFNLKNNFGWKDEQQLSVQSTNTITHVVQALDSKAEEYLNRIIDVTAEAQRLAQPTPVLAQPLEIEAEPADINTPHTNKVEKRAKNVSRATKKKTVLKKIASKNSKKRK